MKKISIVVIVLSVLLVVAVGFIGYNLYSSAKYTQQLGIYNQGASDGANQILSNIVEKVGTCQESYPVAIGEDQTINLVALECLQQPAAA